MRGEYQVQWKVIWMNLAKYMSMAILMPLILLIGVRIAMLGYNGAFEYLSPLEVVCLLGGACLFSVVFSLVIALWTKLASISVFDGWLFGRGYWGFKKRIPFSDIVSMDLVNHGGMNVIAVKSSYHGSIYISVHTERLEELIGVIESYSECETAEGS